MTTIPKITGSLFISFCLAAMMTVEGCKSHDSTSTATSGDGYSQPADSIRKKEVEFQVNAINAKLDSAILKKIPYPAPGSTDTLEYWLVDNKPARLSLKSYPTDFMLWNTFFVKDDQLILVRSRMWFKALPMPWTEENMIFLHDNKIFYCDERKMELPNNDIPASLRAMPFAMSKKSFAELEKKYQADWVKIKEILARQ